MLFNYKNIIKLNTTEKTIYQYVVNNMDAVLKMNVRELADATFVSTATIVRFTQKMGCDGFNDFKKQLKEYKAGVGVPDQNEFHEKLIKEIDHSEKPEVQEKIVQFAKKISDSKMTVFLGIGKCGYIAGFAARYMMEIGYNAMAVTDPFYPLICNDLEDMTIIALSTSGETIEVVDQLKAYKKLGATIYSITGSPDSTIAGLSDLSINYDMFEEVLPSMSKLTMITPIVYILERIGWRLIMSEGRNNEVPPVSFHK